jgi:hypothetical protein
MVGERCVHGMDRRFCAICNRARPQSRPRGAIADTTLAEILRFLNDEQIRATYGAVAGLLGIGPRSLAADGLGSRRPEASWIVAADGGLPTGYDRDQMHPALFRTSEVIQTGTELAMRMTAWRAKRPA